MFESIPATSPFKDLAGFRMPDKDDSSQQRVKALAIGTTGDERKLRERQDHKWFFLMLILS